MTKLFKKITINKMEIKNRFVMSAAADNLDAKSDARIKRFTKLAEGGVGLIISGGLRNDEILRKFEIKLEELNTWQGKYYNSLRSN